MGQFCGRLWESLWETPTNSLPQITSRPFVWELTGGTPNNLMVASEPSKICQASARTSAWLAVHQVCAFPGHCRQKNLFVSVHPSCWQWHFLWGAQTYSVQYFHCISIEISSRPDILVLYMRMLKSKLKYSKKPQGHDNRKSRHFWTFPTYKQTKKN